jgi:hypothetical protein
MYRFNLESLLNHRRYQEEVFQKELAGLKIRLTAEKDKLWVLRQKKTKIRATASRKTNRGTPGI